MDQTVEAEREELVPLVERVAQGEELTITRHGRVVARLVPIAAPRKEDVTETVARLKAFRKGRKLGDVTLKELIEEGRR